MNTEDIEKGMKEYVFETAKLIGRIGNTPETKNRIEKVKNILFEKWVSKTFNEKEIKQILEILYDMKIGVEK